MIPISLFIQFFFFLMSSFSHFSMDSMSPDAIESKTQSDL